MVVEVGRTDEWFDKDRIRTVNARTRGFLSVDRTRGKGGQCKKRPRHIAAASFSPFGVMKDMVKLHLKNIFNKLDVNDRVSAVREAYTRGFLK